jgi:hypothetical protein
MLFTCSCSGLNDPSYPPFSIKLGTKDNQYWFFMKGRDYLVFNQGSNTCKVLFQQVPQGWEYVWYLGTPFLRAYYSIYDIINKRIGLVGIAE